MPPKNLLRSLVIVGALLGIRVDAVTRLASADGQFWDIQDTSSWAQDSGGIATGGRANPFNGFGYLKLAACGAPPAARARAQPIPARLRPRTRRRRALRLDHAGARRRRRRRARDLRAEGHELSSLRRPLHQHDSASRASSTSPGAAPPARSRTAATSPSPRRPTAIAGSISTDTFVTVMQNAREVADPMRGPVGPRAVRARAGLASRRAADGDRRHVRRSVRRHLARLRSRAHRLRLHAHARARPDRRADDLRRQGPERDLRSRAAASRSRCGTASSRRNLRRRTRGPTEDSGGGIRDRAVTETARRLVAAPDLRGLTPRQRAADRQLASRPRRTPAAPFTVVEKTAPQIAGRADARRRDDGRRRPRVPGAAVDSRPSRPGAAIDAGA